MLKLKLLIEKPLIFLAVLISLSWNVTAANYDVALIKPLVNINDTNGEYYQEYWYFAFNFMY